MRTGFPLRGRVARGLAVLLFGLGLAACPSVEPAPSASPTPPQPRPFAGVVRDAFSGRAVAGAWVEVRGSDAGAITAADGSFAGTALPGTDLRVEAGGYDAAMIELPEQGDLAIDLRPSTVSGRVTDAQDRPIAGARVFVEGTENVVATDSEGAYRLEGVPEDAVLVYKAAGHTLAERSLESERSATIDVALDPFVVRALYAPSAVFEAPGRLEQILALADRTEINALVIDVKETDGRLYYATDLPAAVAIGAVREDPLFRLEELLPALKQRGIYTIARMVVSKDNTLGTARPELAVQNSATGGPWQDRLGGIWLDPFQPGVWEYVVSVATDLADRGFDEVQLDYVRFLSDGPYEEAQLLLPNSQSHRLPALRRLFRMADAEFDHRRAFLSADVFPIAFIRPDDQGIGQRADVVMPYVDYLSPMIYPSHFGAGMFGFEVPNEHPYEVVDASIEIIQRQAEGLPVRMRPWIQDFGYGPHRAYGPADVRAQIEALADNGVPGWMIWNPSATFTEAALGPPRADEVPAPPARPSPAPSATPGSRVGESPAASP